MSRDECAAAYTPPVGMKSLERKLMHNGERGADYFEPEWAEVRVVMRERDELRRLLIAVQVEEINGRLCTRPESHKDRCCPVCRDLWRRIDEALSEEAEPDAVA